MKCADCKFFLERGECHLHAPTLVAVAAAHMDMPAEHQKPGYTYSAWPKVAADNFCGDFQAITMPGPTP